tara:strand:- start:1980 stop:2234 length:255 start_codon:yes stop_codon:yes gene_type:complete
MAHYNNGTSLEELSIQMECATPKYYVSIADKQLKKQMRKEKEAINRVKMRIHDNKVKEGLESETESHFMGRELNEDINKGETGL